MIEGFKEAGRDQSIDNAVIRRQREITGGADVQPTVDDNGAILDRANGQNSDLRRIDDRGEALDLLDDT